MMLKLRELRKKCGLTMKELGEEIGVAESTISQYETGKRQPDFETLLKLGEFFGVSVDYILTGEDNKKAPALTDKDRRDVAKLVENIMSDMEQAGDLNFDGMPMSEEARAAMASAMRIGLEEARRRNKETYTPKKYRKG